MPTVNTHSEIPGRFPHLGVYRDSNHTVVLSEKVPHISQILKTHILGDDGTYLIPISLILETRQQQTFKNPYSSPRPSQYLNSDEISRLENHSIFTKQLIQSQKNYKQACNESDDFRIYPNHHRLSTAKSDVEQN